jgi:two-component system OmpR family sensor kinase
MRRITLEIGRMGQLVDDMLRLARLGQHPGQSSELVDVTALVNACAERVTIEVRDDGPGVPPDKLPHIFERFYRAADTRASRAPRSARLPGSGLGLAIAAEIAAAHAGAATAAPVSPTACA